VIPRDQISAFGPARGEGQGMEGERDMKGDNREGEREAEKEAWMEIE
jgi:hypothetical protein